jgi:micrococcal nuclease
MERLAILFIFFLQLVLAPTLPAGLPNKKHIRAVATQSAVLVSTVVDGDTFHIETNGEKHTIRVLGIDTPEVVDPRRPVQCYGKEASAKAKELLTGRHVTLLSDPTQADKDRYGRWLRYVTLPDGADYGLLMIREGYAHEYTYNGVPHMRAQSYTQAESVARTLGRGLWGPAVCVTPTPR